MANIKSAKKRAKQAVLRNRHNSIIRSKYRTTLKKAKKSLAEGSLEITNQLLKTVQSEGQKAARKNILKSNKIARDISKLNAAIKSATNTTNREAEAAQTSSAS